ncbi:lasso peptide biosynthesis B2 protein [Litchfieldella rifensis]|uniref:Lasso peptide biosynthesis B2 protein n=1 Tax=Litchfieldella rifensis TaxID=762643 RepID=A0ABV7LV42_9GAMM
MEAAFLLPWAWILVRTLPFRFWSRGLGKPTPGEADPAVAAVDKRARDICWAIVAINQAAGDRFTCLMLAMTAQWMLNRRHISSSLVLGTRTEQGADNRLTMQAHAWLRVGARIVLGHHGGQYTAISSFVRTYRRHADG